MKLREILAFWAPLTVEPDAEKPFELYRGDSLTVHQETHNLIPGQNLSWKDRLAFKIHGVKLNIIQEYYPNYKRR